jgi:DNA-dependent metalloprotease WSS1
MNHGSDFQNLWKQLRNEVRALQIKGYYGDGRPCLTLKIIYLCLSMIKGYWSAGTRLADSSKVVGQGVESGEFPEYMVCTRPLCINADPL